MANNATPSSPSNGGAASFLNAIEDTPATSAIDYDALKLTDNDSSSESDVEDVVDADGEESTEDTDEGSQAPQDFLNSLDEEGETSDEDSDVEAPKTKKQEEPTKYKLKVDGQEEEVTKDDMMKLYKSLDLDDINEEPTISQLKNIYKIVKSSNAKNYRASEETKRAKRIFERLDEDFFSVAEEYAKQKNIDVDGLFEKRLAKKLKLSMMSEQEREAFLKAEKDAKDLESYRKREEAEKRAREEQQHKELVGNRAKEIIEDIESAYASDPTLIRNDETFRMFTQWFQTAAHMLRENQEAAKVGKPKIHNIDKMPTAQALIPLVKKMYREKLDKMMALVPDDHLIDSLGEDHVKRIRKQDAKRLQKEQRQGIKGVGKKPVVSTKTSGPKKKTEDARSFFDSLK
jgi:hypothetical protein